METAASHMGSGNIARLLQNTTKTHYLHVRALKRSSFLAKITNVCTQSVKQNQKVFNISLKGCLRTRLQILLPLTRIFARPRMTRYQT